ncbi:MULTISPECIES: NAD(P)-dependent oxidoreductase [Aerococcus]|uniref:Lactate dehydrogenase n=1 Tax=Aerococcus tenax TaxID=3078812 RepID=A0A5N1BPU0_9LACT|nr:NAD(P)-dependent oxidoreductase [Aerococcus urinae]KAA9240352.1 lactate dehydrogenase [Aerococcus urinae]MDK7302785.1 NAD(P)-dependent oxidoreductase [Aerococcus urinae]MDK7801431.1 NAD(P)-dependent oxidoreductase [Aerococcus urinae]MDK8655029.1 NAD(P)-dependent oxidoreductase [Aerococcus urinae]RAV70822.1 lactate dehydrogenase [Aerococcus urinae]
MTFKVACYGVRSNEVDIFKQYNKYNYDLTLIEDLLTEDNIETAKGYDAVLLRGNCVANRRNLELLKSWGIDLVFTRTVGINHIDMEAIRDLEQVVARVPGYSPNAIAELSVTLAMSLLRNVPYTTEATAKEFDFRVKPRMFSREVRNCTVGIIGCGRIGLTEAKLFQGLGAKVIGYDIYQSDAAKEVVEFKDNQDDLLKEADIVSIHSAYIEGENDQMINQHFIETMKDDAILVNTARGELQDNQAIIDALKADKLYGFAADVLPNEGPIFFHNFDRIEDVPDETVQELIKLYPRVLLTPHVGSNTDEAVKNMVEYSMDNFEEYLTTGKVANLVE